MSKNFMSNDNASEVLAEYAEAIKGKADDTNFTPITGNPGEYVDGTAGLVPAPTGTPANRFLREDGSWQVVESATYPMFTYQEGDVYSPVTGESAPTWESDTYYSKSGSTYTLTTSEPEDWSTNYTDYYTKSTGQYIAIDYGS